MQRYKDILSRFPGKRVVVVGDVMLDQYIMGSASRLTDDEPRVVVLDEEAVKYIPGGAANTASNIKSLEGKVSLFGVLGNDDAGTILREKVSELGVDFYPSPTSAWRTTRKTRIIAGTVHLGNHHHLLRCDYEDCRIKNINYPSLKREAKKADIIVVSDYAKGVVSAPLINLLRTFKKPIIVDPKPKNIYLYSGMYLVKLNKKEALESTDLLSVYDAGKALQKLLGSKIIITQGSHGMSIFNDGVHEIPTTAREVYDVTGAGDTTLAALAMSLAAGATVEDAAVLANYAAGIAVERAGNASVKLCELEQRIFNKV